MKPVELIRRVRQRLQGPLAQSPSSKDILQRALDEYQNAMGAANNTGNAQGIKEFTLTTSADQRRYEITAADYGKALSVVTVPDSDYAPEQILEFTQLEQIPKDWMWLARNASNWFGLFQSYISQKARYAAFYNLLEADGFHPYMEIRPTPAAGEQYRVLYQVGNWQSGVPADLDFTFPFPSDDQYFVALISLGILDFARWANGEDKSAKLFKSLSWDVERYGDTFRNHIATLTQAQVVFGESYSDYLGL